jgi:uncharacterized Tic20 family protein
MIGRLRKDPVLLALVIAFLVGVAIGPVLYWLTRPSVRALLEAAAVGGVVFAISQVVFYAWHRRAQRTP